MHHRLQQHRHHHSPQPPVEDLRLHLNRIRHQRESDEAAGIPPPEDSYIHNLPKHQKHVGYPHEKNNRSVGQAEWDQGKLLNIKIEVNEGGEKIYKMDKDEVLKVPTSTCSSQGPLCNAIIKNENESGAKIRGRGRYRGAPRSRGYSRGRGRAGFRGRGGSRRSWGRGRASNAETASNSSSLTEPDSNDNDKVEAECLEASGEQHKDEEAFDDDCSGEEYHDEYTEAAQQSSEGKKIVKETQKAESKECTLIVEVQNDVKDAPQEEPKVTEAVKAEEVQKVQSATAKSESINEMVGETVKQEQVIKNVGKTNDVVESNVRKSVKSETVDSGNKDISVSSDSKNETNK